MNQLVLAAAVIVAIVAAQEDQEAAPSERLERQINVRRGRFGPPNRDQQVVEYSIYPNLITFEPLLLFKYFRVSYNVFIVLTYSYNLEQGGGEQQQSGALTTFFTQPSFVGGFNNGRVRT